MKKTKIAFICVHNSCRSQMAEAVAKHRYNHLFESYSAGTEVKSEINQTAVKLINQKLHINMNETQHSKLITDIPDVDIVITMGCNVDCPHLPNKHREDWGLTDPSGGPFSDYEHTLVLIEEKMENLITRIDNKVVDLS